jgi:hypothetical protein
MKSSSDQKKIENGRKINITQQKDKQIEESYLQQKVYQMINELKLQQLSQQP